MLTHSPTQVFRTTWKMVLQNLQEETNRRKKMEATLWNIRIRRINLYYLEDFENVSTASATRTTFAATKAYFTTIIRFIQLIHAFLFYHLG